MIKGTFLPIHIFCLTSVLARIAGSPLAETSFNQVASFAVPRNMAKGEVEVHESSAEIISVSADCMVLAYADSPLGALGRIDISDPADPRPLGNIALGGEPTAVSAVGPTAYVAVNTSESFSEPSDHLAAMFLPLADHV